MKPELIEALRGAAAAIRGQIPAGELTVASVQRLLQAADAVLAEASAAAPRNPGTRSPSPASKRQEAREKWARIARQNATEMQRPPTAAD
jgi:hypothetical protein